MNCYFAMYKTGTFRLSEVEITNNLYLTCPKEPLALSLTSFIEKMLLLIFLKQLKSEKTFYRYTKISNF